jgi:hypothetical protein
MELVAKRRLSATPAVARCDNRTPADEGDLEVKLVVADTRSGQRR